MDDAILTALVPLKAFFSPSTARWTPGAHDICFTKSWHGTFFALGQVCVAMLVNDENPLGGVHTKCKKNEFLFTCNHKYL